MGTIVTRRRKDGTSGYLAQIILKRDGKVIHQEAVARVHAVCRDYFSHLTPAQFVRKATEGKIDLPVVMIEGSQKAARGVHLQDLADWIDKRRAAARKENDQLHGQR